LDVVNHEGVLYAIGVLSRSGIDHRPALWASTDAITWSSLTINEEDAVDSTWNALDSSDQLLVAVGQSNLDHVDSRAWTSSNNGESWVGIEVETGPVGIPALHDVTWSGAGWVAVGSDGTTRHEFGDTIAAIWQWGSTTRPVGSRKRPPAAGLSWSKVTFQADRRWKQTLAMTVALVGL